MRKTFLTLLLLLPFLLQAQRNVLLIIADDIGTDYFGFYEDHLDTVGVPHIAALLNNGIRFKNAMSNPVCSSTRAGILTGRYSFRHGVGYIVGNPSGSGTLDTAEITIPKLLNIYNPSIAKANIGKWHLHNPSPAANLLNPLILGYNHFEGPFIGALPDYYSWQKHTNGVASTITTYATTENVNNAVSWLSQQGNNPFFLWMAFNAPHSPFHLPPAGMYSDLTLTGTQQHINANPKKYFKASLEALDFEIGRLMDSLQALNKLDSTDIIFIGDNGNETRTAQITNLDHAKGTVYQYGVHVPFIISGPSVVNPGRVSDALVNTHDIFATVLELFGNTTWQSQIPMNKPVDSKSLIPVINNITDSVRPWTFAEIFRNLSDSSDGKAMRNVEYKLIKFDYGAQEFYNLMNDPDENLNLLNTSMTATDISNYLYLCNEMNALTGSGSCITAIKENENTNITVAYPNPFSNRIHVVDEGAYQLQNFDGHIIYNGNDISKQDFTNLPAGCYLLKDENGKVQKLIKY